MRLRIAILGTDILVVEANRQDPAELLADAITELNTTTAEVAADTDGDTPGQFGVSGCHLERAPEALNWGEDKTFGFNPQVAPRDYTDPVE